MRSHQKFNDFMLKGENLRKIKHLLNMVNIEVNYRFQLSYHEIPTKVINDFRNSVRDAS